MAETNKSKETLVSQQHNWESRCKKEEQSQKDWASNWGEVYTSIEEAGSLEKQISDLESKIKGYTCLPPPTNFLVFSNF